MKKALIVLTSHGHAGSSAKKTGWHLSEASHIYYPLIEAGYEVDFASPGGGAAPIDPSSREEKDSFNAKFLSDFEPMSKINATLKLKDIDPQKYKAIHFAGGHGTMWDFADDPHIPFITASIYERGGVVSAICHGPAALVNVKLSTGEYLIKNKEVCSFTNAEEKETQMEHIVPFSLESALKQRGAKFIAAKNWSDQTQASGRLITGQNPQSGHSLAKKLIQALKKPATIHVEGFLFY